MPQPHDHAGLEILGPVTPAFAEILTPEACRFLRGLSEKFEPRRQELLAAPEGSITEAGVRTNLSVGVQYLEAWLGGLGCVPLYNLMEDAATAEISRSQLWQWLSRGAQLDDGRTITEALYDTLMSEELAKIRGEVGAARFDGGNFSKAVELFMRMVKAEKFEEFLTLPAYELLA